MLKRKLRDAGPAVRQTIFDAPGWRFFSALGDFFLLTCFWLLTSLPVVTMGASTAALFYVFFKTKNGEAGGLWQMYWKSFRENLRQGVCLFLLYLFIALDAGILLYMMMQKGTLTAADFAWGGRYCLAATLALLVYGAVMIYTAALLGYFRQTMGQCVLSAFCLTFNRIFSTLYFMLILGVLGFVTWYYVPPLCFIDVPLAVWLISLRMNVLFRKQVERAEKRSPSGQTPGA